MRLELIVGDVSTNDVMEKRTKNTEPWPEHLLSPGTREVLSRSPLAKKHLHSGLSVLCEKLDVTVSPKPRGETKAREGFKSDNNTDSENVEDTGRNVSTPVKSQKSSPVNDEGRGSQNNSSSPSFSGKRSVSSPALSKTVTSTKTCDVAETVKKLKISEGLQNLRKLFKSASFSTKDSTIVFENASSTTDTDSVKSLVRNRGANVPNDGSKPENPSGNDRETSLKASDTSSDFNDNLEKGKSFTFYPFRCY